MTIVLRWSSAYNESIDERAVECCNSAPVVKDGHGKQTVRLGKTLPPEENDERKKPSDYWRQCRSRSPRVLDTSPGQANKEADHATDKDESANPVSLLQLLRQPDLRDSVETDEHDCDDEANATKWIVNMEAPSPGTGDRSV
jgi:hypothetical protein